MFKWKNEYNTDIPVIDQQHKVLVSLINELDVLINEDFDRELVRALFGKLNDYALYHFETEEALMAQYHYEEADLDAHLLQHRQFEDELASVSGDFGDVSVTDCEVVLTYLTNWLIYHICKVDRRLTDFIHRQQEQEVASTLVCEETLHIEDSVSLMVQVRQHADSADDLLAELEQCLNEFVDDTVSGINNKTLGSENNDLDVPSSYARGLDLVRLLRSNHMDLKSILEILDNK